MDMPAPLPAPRIAHGGKSLYGAPLGILMLQARFPRILGDMGNAQTWPFPVLYKVVRGATPERVVLQGAAGLLDDFLAANPTRQKDWDDSQILLTTDPLLVSSIPAFAAATGTTDAQIIDLLKSCRE